MGCGVRQFCFGVYISPNGRIKNEALRAGRSRFKLSYRVGGGLPALLGPRHAPRAPHTRTQAESAQRAGRDQAQQRQRGTMSGSCTGSSCEELRARTSDERRARYDSSGPMRPRAGHDWDRSVCRAVFGAENASFEEAVRTPGAAQRPVPAASASGARLCSRPKLSSLRVRPRRCAR